MKLSGVASSSAITCPDHHVRSLWKACLQGLEVLQAAGALCVPFAVLIVIPSRPCKTVRMLTVPRIVFSAASYSMLVFACIRPIKTGNMLLACLSLLLSRWCLFIAVLS